MPDNPIGLRPLRPGDAAAAAALIQAAFAAQPVVLDPPASALGVTAGMVAGHLGRGGGAAAERDGHMFGAVLWERRRARCISAGLPWIRWSGGGGSAGGCWRRRKLKRAGVAYCE